MKLNIYFNKQYITLLIVYLFFSTSFSQEIPTDFLEFNLKQLLIDAGMDWDEHSTLGQVRYQDKNHFKNNINLNDSLLYVRSRFGFNGNNKANKYLYGFAHFSYRKYLYGYLYARIVSDPENIDRYSGIPQEISRFSYTSGETDLSGIGYQNKWISYQIGRGRESWGAGSSSLKLALNSGSNAYDYAMLSSTYGKIKVKYIHGFLESKDERILRYITARGLEWSNKNSFLISLSETIVYSGYNRPLDFAYLNPISSHLEVEINNRLNILEGNDANAVWQLSIDWLFNKNLRMSSNILFDEFVIDKKKDLVGKEHGKAYSWRLSYTPKIFKFNTITFYSSLVYIGTPTFRHGNGYNNFIQRGRPIGWQNGSDTKEICFGLNLFNNSNFLLNIETVNKKSGEENILNRPYDPYSDYLKGPFPSGIIQVDRIVFIKFQYWKKKNLSIFLETELKESKQSIFDNSIKFGLDIYFPKTLSI